MRETTIALCQTCRTDGGQPEMDRVEVLRRTLASLEQLEQPSLLVIIANYAGTDLSHCPALPHFVHTLPPTYS